MKTKLTSKKLLALLLTLVMALGMLPAAAFAADEENGGGWAAPVVCSCETACTESKMNSDCPICGAAYAQPADCAHAELELPAEVSETLPAEEAEVPAAYGSAVEDEKVITDYAEVEEAAFGLLAVNSELLIPNFRLTVFNMPESTDPSLNTFKTGDEIEYRFSVDNLSEYNIVPTEVKLRWGEEEKTYNNTYGIWTNPGETSTYLAVFKHIVTEEEAKAGQVVVEATMDYEYAIGDEMVPGTMCRATLTTPVGNYAGLGGVYVYKAVTNTPANGTHYVEGEEVTFNTYIVNETEHTLLGLRVREDHHGQKTLIVGSSESDYVAAGQTRTISSSVVVDHTDYLQRSLSSYSTVTWNDEEDYFEDPDTSITSNLVRVPVGSEDGSGADEDAFVSIEISAEDPPANGVSYVLDELINIKYVVTNCSSKSTAKDLSVFDSLRAFNLMDPLEQDELAPNEVWFGTTKYTISEHDLLSGEFKLQAYVDAWDKDTGEYCGSLSNTLVLPVSGTVPELWQYQDIDLTQKLVSKPANGEYFVPGEKVRITITSHERINGEFSWFHAYNTCLLYYGTGSETMYLEDLEVILSDGINERSQTITHTVTSEDAEQGWIRSDVYGLAGYRIVTEREVDHGELEYITADGRFFYNADPLVVPCGYAEVTGEMNVELTETFKPNNGEYFVAGEYVDLTYTVDNTFEGSLRNPSAGLNVNNGGVKTIDLSGELPKIMDKRHRNFTSYKVTQADVEKGSITFTYSISGTTRDGKTHSAVSNPVTVLCGEAKEPALGIQIIETGTPANGEYYTAGETVEYRVTIVNNGSTDFGECFVYDAHEVDLGSVEKLKVGEEASFEYSRVVSEEDVENGIGVALVFAKTKLNEEWIYSNCMPYFPTGAEALSAWRLVTKNVTSTPENGDYYTEGETITYEIVVQINEDLFGEGYEFRVLDDLTGDMVPCDLDGDNSFKMTAKYTVTAEDVAVGSVTNVATLQTRTNVDRNWGISMNSNAVTVNTGVKTPAGPDENEKYKVTIIYGQANIGNEVVTESAAGESVTIAAASTGRAFDKWVVKAGGISVASETSPVTEFTMPAANVTIEATYKDELPDDLEKEQIVNYSIGHYKQTADGYVLADLVGRSGYVGAFVIATPRTYEGYTYDEGNVNELKYGILQDTEPLILELYYDLNEGGATPGGELVASASVVKEETSAPANGKFYVEGETIAYSITVTNTGDVSFDGGYVVYDILANPRQIADGSHINCLAECVEGESDNTRVFTFEYTVTADDVAAGSVSNYAWLTYKVYKNGVPEEKTATSDIVESKTGVKDVVDPDGNDDPGGNDTPGVVREEDPTNHATEDTSTIIQKPTTALPQTGGNESVTIALAIILVAAGLSGAAIIVKRKKAR